MKVSVVISSYNGEKYIKECIDSILSQTYRNFEIIIVDDQSTDKTVDIVKGYMSNDARIRLYQNLEHNHSAALNYGISMATGTYIARIDQDDLMTTERLEQQVAYMEQNPDCIVCASWFKTFGSCIQECRSYSGRIQNSLISFLLGNLIANPTSMIRLGFLREKVICYNKQYHYAEDYDFWVSCALAGATFDVIPDFLVNYRIHEGQASSKHFSEQAAEALEIQNRLLNSLIERNMFTNDQKVVLEGLSVLNQKDLVSPQTIFNLSYEILINEKNKGGKDGKGVL